MFGLLVTGAGPGLAIYGCPGVGCCRRGKPLFGCQATGCADREAGCESRATGNKIRRTLRICRLPFEGGARKRLHGENCAELFRHWGSAMIAGDSFEFKKSSAGYAAWEIHPVMPVRVDK